ncbi:MAG: protein kinase [Planctomycetes bacterium]|nr:protein kinase [Planctomycetota bacterium]
MRGMDSPGEPNAAGHAGGATPPVRRPATRDPWLGATLGKYRISGKLGQGGMSVVYEAVDTAIHREVALKVLPESVAEQPETLERFLQEARALGRLSHPNVVWVYEVCEAEGVYFLVMERVLGGSAQDLVKAGEALGWSRATEMIVGACRGLIAAHAAGLIHRDIKPGNLLCAPDGTVKLTDFGLAKVLNRGNMSLTKTGRAVGTPQYMSPEQCRGEVVDERSDVYSLGATYYHLLAGQPPYPGEDAMQVMFAHCSSPVPDPRAVKPNLPEACATVTMRAMAKAPDQRYATAADVLADLEAIVARQALPSLSRKPRTATHVRPAPTPTPVRRRDHEPGDGAPSRSERGRSTGASRALAAPSRNTRAVVLGGIGLAVVVAVFWAVSVMTERADRERRDGLEREASTALLEAEGEADKSPFDSAGAKQALRRAQEACGRYADATHEIAGARDFAGKLDGVRARLQKRQDEAKRAQEKRDQLVEIVARARRDLAHSQLQLDALERLRSECESIDRDLAAEVAREKKKLAEEAAADTTRRVRAELQKLDGELRDLAHAASLEPILRRLTDLTLEAEPVSRALAEEVASKKRDAERDWARVAQAELTAATVEIERMLQAGQPDAARLRLQQFPQKYRVSGVSAAWNELVRKVDAALKASRGSGPNPPGTEGGAPGAAADAAALETPGALVPLLPGSRLEGWNAVSVNSQPGIVHWDSPEPGVLHGVAAAADAWTILVKGSPRWRELELEFDAKTPRGDFTLGLLLGSSQPNCTVVYSPREDWHHFRVVVSERQIVILGSNRGNLSGVLDPAKPGGGPIGLGPGRGGEASFRNIQVKVVKLAER